MCVNSTAQRLQMNSCAGQQRPGFWWIVLIFVAALLPRVTNLDVFLAHDETLFWDWSRKFFFSLLEGDFAGTIVGPGNPNITSMWAQVVVMGLQYAWAWLNDLQSVALAEWPAFQPHLVFSELPWRRLPVVLINTLSVTGIWWLCYRLFGRRLALLTAVLLVLDPFVLADSRTGRGEGILTGFVTVALLAFIFFWHSRRWRYLIVSGIVMGLALLTKLSAVSLVPTVGLIGLVYVWQISGLTVWGKTQKIATALIIWGGVALLTFSVLWPAMWVAPTAALDFLWGFVRNVGLEGRTNYFFGELYRSEFLPFYYPVVFILRVTPMALVGLVAFGVLLWLGLVAKLRFGVPWTAAWQNVTRKVIDWPILLVAIYPVIFGIFMTVGVLKRDWYLMPAFPSLDIVAAAGLLWVGKSLWQRFWPQVSPNRVWTIGVGIILLFQAAASLPSHPLYYTYWNPLVLGGKWASQAIMVGWDLDLAMGAHYLNSKPDAANLKVASRTTRGFQEIFRGITVPLAIDSAWVQADYLLVRQTHLQLGKHDPWELNYLPHLELEHVINIGGVDYLWIYRAPRAEYFAGPSQLVGKGTLFGYDMSTQRVKIGDVIHFDLYWLNRNVTDQDTFFVNLIDLGEYVWAETIVQTPLEFKAHNEVEGTMIESFADLEIPVGTPPGRYFLEMGIYSQTKEEEIGLFSLPENGRIIEVTPTDQPLNPPVISRVLNKPASSGLMLLGFDWPAGVLAHGDDNELVFYWQAQEKIEQDLVIGLQLLDDKENEIAYWLGRPVKSSYLTNQWHQGEIIKDPWELNISPNVSPGNYVLRLALYDSADGKVTGVTDLGPITVVDRRRLFEVPPLQHRVDAQLGEAISLLGYNLIQEPLTGGGRFTLKLYWQAKQSPPADYKVFTQVLGPDGTVVGQHDGVPADDTLPTVTWQPGEIISDRHQIDFPTTQGGEYRLIVGMYDPATGTRLSVTNVTGAPIGDFLPLYSFTITEAE